MGRASRSKQDAQAQRRERPQLMKKIREQVRLLQILGRQFDAGDRVLGYPLATAIRVLVHDTEKSHALLAQVQELNTMPFLDTSAPINPKNLLSHGGLVIMKIIPGVGNEWGPRKEAPPASNAQPRDVRFAPWWNTDLMRDMKGSMWNRKAMVLAIANKEGGAHIDPVQPVNVRAIEDENSMGWSYREPIIGNKPMSEGPLMSSIRQIAYELEESITKQLGLGFDSA